MIRAVPEAGLGRVRERRVRADGLQPTQHSHKASGGNVKPELTRSSAPAPPNNGDDEDAEEQQSRADKEHC